MRKIQILITFFWRIFAWGRQNHPDPHCRRHSQPQAPICLYILPTPLVPRARKVACETADSQTTCSRPRGATWVRKKSRLSSSAINQTAHVTVQGEACTVQSFSAVSTVSPLLALDMGGVTDFAVAFSNKKVLRSWEPFCLIESSVKASWFHTSGQYAVHGSLHSNNFASYGSTAHGRRSGETKLAEFATSELCVVYFERILEWEFHVLSAVLLQGKGESKRSFSLQFESQHVCICISFILPGSSKPDAILRRRRYAAEAKFELSRL